VTITVPLKENAFVTRISRDAYPIRIVAYDSKANVIDIQTLQSDDDYQDDRADADAALLHDATTAGGVISRWQCGQTLASVRTASRQYGQAA